MRLKSISLKHFRHYRESTACFLPGTNIIVGGNGAGKSSILEAAQFACCGRSFRTSRDSEMIREGEGFFRVTVETEDHDGAPRRRMVALSGREGVSVDPGGGPAWLPAGSVRTFSPDDLQLVKGPPQTRRRFLDEAVIRRLPAYRRTILDYRKVLSQRNNFLRRARAGLVSIAEIRPWDRQLASLAVRIHQARRDICSRLEPHFVEAYNRVTGGDEALSVRLASQVGEAGAVGTPEEVLLDRLESEWGADMDNARTGSGSHRDDMELTLRGRSLRRFGSQGEQRTAVLALLMADRGLALEEGGAPPVLLLDDVMSELDRDRRGRLMEALRTPGGQALITAADRKLFTGGELEESMLLEISGGEVFGCLARSDV